MQDRNADRSTNSLATHGRTIHGGQFRRNEAIVGESGLPSIAAELTRRSDLAAGDIVVE
jgi:hypothetical protein